MILPERIKKLCYAVLLGRIAGLGALLGEIRRQLHSEAVFQGMEKTLSEPVIQFPAGIDYYLKPALETDMMDILEIAKYASKDSAYQLLFRKLFYDSGFHRCYVAKTTDSGELCYMGWILSSRDHPELKNGFKGNPPLKENEVLLFNLFAFEKFRGKGLASSVDSQLCNIARESGYKRAIAFPLKNNLPAVKALEKIGFKKCCKKHEKRFLFVVKREFSYGLNHDAHAAEAKSPSMFSSS
jgi:RimJ/RimL family protein N-acetyltransferase